MSKKNAIVCGVDIGYSNVKIATGDAFASVPDVSIFPAYATTEEEEDVNLVKRNRAHEVTVYPNGNMWRAFTDRPDGRELHDSYHTTEMYMALYFGSLAKIAEKVGNTVDLLVTGLSVRLASDDNERSKLVARLTGTFAINPTTKVTVKQVMVIPQGVGVINDVANREGFISEDELSESNILVIDPGFFSMDYVAFSNGSRVMGSSGSSLKATSTIIEGIVRMLNEENPHERRDDLPEMVEIALRKDAPTFFNGARHIEVKPLLSRVIPQIAGGVVKELRKNVRSLGAIHIIVTAGGGAPYYELAVREAFQNARVVTSPNPVASNAIGFWNYGVDTVIYGDA